MTEEIIDDEILAEELADDALEKKMRKLEAEAARILQQSDELIRAMNKEKAPEASEDGGPMVGESAANSE